MRDHPTFETLDEFVYECLEEGDAKTVREHLAGCSNCSRRAAEVQEERQTLVGGLEGALAPARLEGRILERLEGMSPRTRKKAPWRKRWAWQAAAAAAIVAVAATLVWPRLGRGSRIVDGSGEIARDGAAWRPVESGMALRPGDAIRTGIKEEAEIQLADGSLVRLREDTVLAIQEFFVDEGGQVLWLSQGEVYCRVVPRVATESGPFQVKTIAGTVTVLGTEFTIRLEWPFATGPSRGGKIMNVWQKTAMLGGGAVVTVAVVGGVVSFANSLGEVRLEKGELAVASEKSEPERFTFQDYQRVKAELEEKSKALDATQARVAELDEAFAQRPSQTGASASQESGLPEHSPTSVEERSEAGAAPTDSSTKIRDEKKAKELIREMDWDGFATLYLKLQRLGTKAYQDTSVSMGWAKSFSHLMKIAAALGEDFGTIWTDELISEAFVPAMFRARGAELTPAQEQELIALSSKQEERESAEASNSSGQGKTILEGSLKEFLSKVHYEQQVQQILTASQYEAYSEGGATEEYGYANMIPGVLTKLPAPDAKVAGGSVAKYWQKEFGLDSAQAQVIGPIAEEYAHQYLSLVNGYESQYQGTLPTEKTYELSVKLVKLQMESEKKIAAQLALTPEQQAQVEKGSSSLIKLER